MGPVRQNPIQRTVRTAHPSVLMTVHSFSTQYNTRKYNARKYFFSSRVITIWNQLPAEVLNAVTVAAFVAKLRSCNLSRYLL